MMRSTETTNRQPLEIDFTNDREREYFARATLGEEVIGFLNSPVGRYLHGCAKQELEQAKNDLLECDLEAIWRWRAWRARRRIRKLQQRAAAAQYFIQWCVEAINDGEAAFQQLSSEI